jgi:hypothetical protein
MHSFVCAVVGSGSLVDYYRPIVTYVALHVHPLPIQEVIVLEGSV